MLRMPPPPSSTWDVGKERSGGFNLSSGWSNRFYYCGRFGVFSLLFALLVTVGYVMLLPEAPSPLPPRVQAALCCLTPLPPQNASCLLPPASPPPSQSTSCQFLPAPPTPTPMRLCPPPPSPPPLPPEYKLSIPPPPRPCPQSTSYPPSPLPPAPAPRVQASPLPPPPRPCPQSTTPSPPPLPPEYKLSVDFEDTPDSTCAGQPAYYAAFIVGYDDPSWLWPSHPVSSTTEWAASQETVAGVRQDVADTLTNAVAPPPPHPPAAAAAAPATASATATAGGGAPPPAAQPPPTPPATRRSLLGTWGRPSGSAAGSSTGGTAGSSTDGTAGSSTGGTSSSSTGGTGNSTAGSSGSSSSGSSSSGGSSSPPWYLSSAHLVWSAWSDCVWMPGHRLLQAASVTVAVWLPDWLYSRDAVLLKVCVWGGGYKGGWLYSRDAVFLKVCVCVWGVQGWLAVLT